MLDQTTFQPTSTELELIETSNLDLRSDEGIAALIQSDRPIRSPKNVWSFWDKGWDVLAKWKQRCIISWVRRLDSTWDVRVLDVVPGSPHHISRFGLDNLLLDAVKKNRMTGKHAPQHTSDLIRLPLVYIHGGVWLDVACFLFRDLDDICWNAISDPHNPHKICGMQLPRPVKNGKNVSLFNGFIASLPGDPFILNWHRMFLSLWKDRTNSLDISSDPLIAAYAWEPTKDLEAAAQENWTQNVLSDYVAHMICFERLLSIIDPSTRFSGPEYWQRHFRLLHLSEIYPEHRLVSEQGFSEEEAIRLLNLPRSESVPRDDQAQLDAERLVEGALAHACFKKLSSGLWGNPLDTVAGTWDAHEEDVDVKSGTWADYLRWGSVFLKQKRQIPILEAEIPLDNSGAMQPIYEVGILEPVTIT